MDARNSPEQYMKIKMSTYGLNQKNQRKKRSSRLAHWKGCFPSWLGNADKVQLLPVLKALPWLPAEGCAHCGENKAGWAVLHCHGLRDRGNETEAFVNSKHFCFSMICLFFLSDFKWSNHKSLQKEGK